MCANCPLIVRNMSQFLPVCRLGAIFRSNLHCFQVFFSFAKSTFMLLMRPIVMLAIPRMNGCPQIVSSPQIVSNLFYLSIQDKILFPLILFVDGHISHMSLPVGEF